MVYKSYEDIANCIRRSLWKVPSDIDLVVGVPRSGMIPAFMLAEYLNKRCTDIDTFLEGREMSYGTRGGMMRRGTEGKVLVIDDCVCSGGSMRKVRERLAPMTDRYSFIYCCVYAESSTAEEQTDFYFEDITQSDRVYMKEWNILHLFKNRTKASMWDIDGLLSKDPPLDKDIFAYESYLPNAIPMIIPTNRVGALVTYRLEKYRAITEEWLKKHGVEYGELFMFNAPSRDIRNTTLGSAEYKAQIYKNTQWALMFIESDRRQAEKIYQLSGKPVFCYENGKLYM